MTKTVYLLVHVDYPLDELLDSIIDPDEESKPTIYLKLDLAEKDLQGYLERGLEYTIRTLVLNFL